MSANRSPNNARPPKITASRPPTTNKDRKTAIREPNRLPPAPPAAVMTTGRTRPVVHRETDVTHSPTRTISPGGRPLARSASSALCRITTAAAWSTALRLCRAEIPRSRMPLVAATVDRRSSTSRTGHGATRFARSRANVAPRRRRTLVTRQRQRKSDDHLDRRPLGHDVRQPIQVSGSAVNSLHGVASIPSGSHAATPTRTLPTSTPTRTPGRTLRSHP